MVQDSSDQAEILDLRGLKCPMPALLLRRRLTRAQSGEEPRAPGRPEFPRQFVCTPGTLKGAYGVMIKGNLFNAPGLPIKQYAGLSLVTFDGYGNFSSSRGMANANGNVGALADETGTYTIDSDCKGVMKGAVLDYAFIASREGNEFDLIQIPKTGPLTPIPAILSGIGKRVAPYDEGKSPMDRAKSFYCSMGMIAGTWSFAFEGRTNEFPPLPPGPFTGVITMHYDATGAFTGFNRAVFGGVYIEAPQQGQQAYVNSDCTTAGAGDVSGYGILVNGGREFLTIGVYPPGINFPDGKGIVTTGIAKRVR